MKHCKEDIGSVAGRVHSIQSLGTLDGPGIRFVVFVQGCNLRCGCCHNPDTWQVDGGTLYEAEELVKKAVRYKEYFADKGGVTVSGGEPLLQSRFVQDFFERCKREGINTCLDTSGDILNDSVKDLLRYTDRVLLDLKYSTDELYLKHVGCSIEAPLSFLKYLNEQNIKVTLRQVIIKGLNDNKENMDFLKRIVKEHSCIDGVELLPFKKICTVKYESLGIPFKFLNMDVPSSDLMDQLQAEIDGIINK